MAEHPLFADDMAEIVESFLVETRELFDGLDNDLLRLERTPDDRALVDHLFRRVHTVKGTAGFLGLEQLMELAHHFEDVLNRLRRGTLTVRPGTVDALLAAFDTMQRLVQQVADRRLEPVDLAPVLARLHGLLEAEPPPSQEPAETLPAVEAAPEAPPAPAPGAAPSLASERPASERPASEPPRTATEAPPSDDGSRAAPRGAETIRVPVERLDALMDLVGELVLSRNRLLQLLGEDARAEAESDLLRDVRGATGQLDFVTTELQAAVMRTRMVQIGRVFARFPRLVRDLAAECGKEVELVLEGEDTELDKSIIEEIADPLVHLVRNAVDHGIEPPDVRRAAGKPARGRLRLAAAHEGDHIVIEVEDDGAGIDPEKVRRKAVEKGFLSAQEAAALSDADALQLIFRPGFSTAQQVSQVSGRGVGTDVVKTNLARLNGSVVTHSVVGVGTRFTLKVPLTLAIIQSLLVRVGTETFALPLHAVDEVVGLDTQARASIRGREVLRHRDAVVPLLRLGQALAVRGYVRPDTTEYAVVVDVAHHRLGLVVDALVGQQEIVIKPLGEFLRKPPCLAGSAILGDGRVVMVLDLGDLVARAGAAAHALAA